MVSVEKHKTVKKGPAEVWISAVDQVYMQAYIRMMRVYAKHHGKNYGLDNPIFLNRDCKPFKDANNKRQINYGMFCRIAKISHLENHDARRMFGSFYGVQPSLTLREAGALASSHR